MSTVTLSETFNVQVPEEARTALHLKAGDKLAIFTHADRIELIPVRPVRQYRGILHGMNSDIERDQKDRL